MMIESHVLVSRALAVGATAAAILLTMFVGYFGSDRAFTPGDMATLCGTVAVIWGTKYTADNVIELRMSTARAITPQLQVALREAYYSGDGLLVAEVHNVGAIGIVGITADMRLVYPNAGPAEWRPIQLSQSFLVPNSHAEADLRERRLLPYVAAVDIRVAHDSMISPRVESLWRFESVNDSIVLSGRRIV